jgi:hypothetical protein
VTFQSTVHNSPCRDLAVLSVEKPRLCPRPPDRRRSCRGRLVSKARAPGRPSGPAVLGPVQADDHHRLAARRQTADWRTAAAAMGAHARLRRPLPDQIPPLVRHPRPAPHRPQDHRRQQDHPDGERDPWGHPVDEITVLILKT